MAASWAMARFIVVYLAYYGQPGKKNEFSFKLLVAAAFDILSVSVLAEVENMVW